MQSEEILAGPWRRFGARYIDLFAHCYINALIIGYLTALYAPAVYLVITGAGEAVFAILLIATAMIATTLSMLLFGSTIGKFLLGVKVLNTGGQRRVTFTIMRELNVWARGMVMGLPILHFIALIYQYRRVNKGLPASYDVNEATVTAISIGPLRAALAFMTIFGLMASASVLNTLDEQDVQAMKGTYSWKNPVNGKQVSLSKAWVYDPKLSGENFLYFSNDALLLEAVVSYEELSEDMAADTYTNALKDLYSEDITFHDPATIVIYNNNRAVRINGIHSDKLTQIQMTATINFPDSWRVLIYSRGRPASEVAIAEPFVEAIFKSFLAE